MNRLIVVILGLNLWNAFGMEKSETTNNIPTISDYFAGYTACVLLKNQLGLRMPVFMKKKVGTLLPEKDIKRLGAFVRSKTCDDGDQQYLYAGNMSNNRYDTDNVSDQDAKTAIGNGVFITSQEEIPTGYGNQWHFNNFIVAGTYDQDESRALYRRIIRDFIQLCFKKAKESFSNPYEDLVVFKEENGYYLLKGNFAQVMNDYCDDLVQDKYTLVVKNLSPSEKEKTEYKKGLAILVGENQNEAKAQDLAHCIWFQHIENQKTNDKN